MTSADLVAPDLGEDRFRRRPRGGDRASGVPVPCVREGCPVRDQADTEQVHLHTDLHAVRGGAAHRRACSLSERGGVPSRRTRQLEAGRGRHALRARHGGHGPGVQDRRRGNRPDRSCALRGGQARAGPRAPPRGRGGSQGAPGPPGGPTHAVRELSRRSSPGEARLRRLASSRGQERRGQHRRDAGDGRLRRRGGEGAQGLLLRRRLRPAREAERPHHRFRRVLPRRIHCTGVARARAIREPVSCGAEKGGGENILMGPPKPRRPPCSWWWPRSSCSSGLRSTLPAGTGCIPTTRS